MLYRLCILCRKSCVYVVQAVHYMDTTLNGTLYMSMDTTLIESLYMDVVLNEALYMRATYQE